MNRQREKELFAKLDKWIGVTTNIITEENCCVSPMIRTDGIWDTCLTCGRMEKSYEFIIKKKFLNPRYQLSTCIRYNNKHKNISRLHKWINYDYRENMANRNYLEIKEIGDKLNLDDKIINNSCILYKQIYIDNNISSRNKIKRSLFIYCLMKSCSYYKKPFNIIEVLKNNNLSIGNYNKSLLKITDDNKLFLNKNMPLYFEKMNKNFNDKKISLNQIINYYNKICSLNKKCRLNNNSILLGSIYNLLDLEDDTKFYKIFNITKTTIEKFNKLIK